MASARCHAALTPSTCDRRRVYASRERAGGSTRLVREPLQFRDDIVQRRRSGGSGRASPRSSPARKAAARQRLCSYGIPTASRTAPCATGTRRTAGASSRRSGGGRAVPRGTRACSGILPRPSCRADGVEGVCIRGFLENTIKRTLHNDVGFSAAKRRKASPRNRKREIRIQAAAAARPRGW